MAVGVRDSQGRQWMLAASHGGGGSRENRFEEGRCAPFGSLELEVPFGCAGKGSSARGEMDLEERDTLWRLAFKGHT